MMRKTLAILLSLSLASVIAAAGVEKRRLNKGQVVRIEITKHGRTAKRLDSDQAKAFIFAWNQSDPKGPCKYTVEYWIRVYLVSGEQITYRTNRQHIKAEDDHCFAVEERQVFDSLWDASGK